MNRPKISILCCSLPNRLKTFSTIEEAERQARGLPVEVLYLGDNWKNPTGVKRNILKNNANGLYMGFIDDDDELKPDYVSSILEATQYQKDVICFDVEITQNGGDTKPVYFSKNHRRDENRKSSFIRLPNHLMYYKRRIAQGVDFKKMTMGEDSLWAKSVKIFLESEHKIDKFLYHYIANTETSESIKNIGLHYYKQRPPR